MAKVLIKKLNPVEHIENDEEALNRVQQALKSGGYLFMSVPQHRFLWSHADVIARHKRRYSRCELEKKLTSAGFEILFSSSFVSFLLPLMFISRFSQRTEYDPKAEFCISRFANRIGMLVLYVELAMIKAGVRFPFGGSRIVVARVMK